MIIGIVAGFLNIMAGGGSLITVPVMIFMGVPGPIANGTNRIAVLAQNITGVFTFFKKGFSDFKLSLTLSLCALPGAVAGALAGVHIDDVWFNRVLAIIMLSVMLLIAFEGKQKAADASAGVSPRRLLLGHLCMVGVGFYGGFIQLGVGFIIMPVLNKVMGMDLVRVNMHKTFIIASYTIVALIVFVSQLEILWLAGFCLAIGMSLGGWLGVHAAISKGEKLIKMILNAVIIVFVIKLLFFT